MKRRPAASARTRAVEALRQVLEKGRHAAPLVGELSGGLPPSDRDLLRELVLGVLRWKDGLDAEIAAACRVPLPRLAPNLHEILEVALYQLRHLDRVPAYAAVSEAVDHARASGGEGAAKLVNGVLRGLLSRAAPTAPRESGIGNRESEELAVYFSHPAFLVERWLSRFGVATTRRILEADNAPPRLDLLANPRRVGRDELGARLAGEGVSTEPSPLAPLALTVLAGNPLRSKLFEAGYFSVQDIGSQLLPLLLPEGELLVDLAAAPGGKSFSAIAHGRARRTVCVDRSPERLARLVENARRLHVPEARPIVADFAALALPEGRFDRVLLDSPCSGTGTLRKNPEIRYRVSAAAIERMSRVEEEALRTALRLLAPDGLLLYSTCSLEEEENERVVEKALAGSPGVEPSAIAASAALRPFVDGARLRLFPDDRVDGFTAHLLRRGR